MGNVMTVGGDAPFGAVDAVSGVFELAVAWEVAFEEFGEFGVVLPAALVVDFKGF